MSNSNNSVPVVGISVVCMALLALLAVPFWLWPTYRVWQREMAGKAELAEAEWSKQIAIQEAKAKYESAIELAKAEVERAKGVAEANKIIGESLEGNESYLRYLWIQALQEDTNSVIYVPTEANLPILEAGRLGGMQPKQEPTR